VSNPVGRPYKKDKEGKKIITAPISVNLPIGQIHWIQEQKVKNPKFNVSAYVVDLIQNSIEEGMCPNCYGTNLLERSIGLSCEDCTAKRMRSEGGVFNPNLVHYVFFYNCENCATPLDLWNKRAYFGGTETKSDIRGCTVCARVPFQKEEELDEEMLKRLKEEEDEESKNEELG